MKHCTHRSVTEQMIGRRTVRTVVQDCMDCGKFRMMHAHSWDALDQWTRWMGEDVREG